ncbi:30S ribosomal protein S2 [Smittium culicis]|uniref:30S ribosomal protein S2 n=1 Tax=Smittium culicis TaxID=133412 RepID=A0A1R1XNM2_9FUNG|nr:30S ribosomal protein S2 [Smittium culicis]OMJ16192.1 30S ribosomal protein S2 [Smittium culicis]
MLKSVITKSAKLPTSIRLFSSSVTKRLPEITANDAQVPETPEIVPPTLTKQEKIQINNHLNNLLPKLNKIGSQVNTHQLYTRQATSQRNSFATTGIDKLKVSDLVCAGVHLGHSHELMHPLNLSTVFGTRNGINIINLEQTVVALRRAMNFTRAVAKNGGIILFAGTKPFMKSIAIDAAYRCDQYYVVDKWVAGTLTNSSHLLTKQHAYITDKLDVEPSPAHAQAPTSNTNNSKNSSKDARKKQSRYEIRLEQMQKKSLLESNAIKTYKPDLIICLNPIDLTTLLNEADREYVPTIALCDTNFDPTKVSFAIPANDDSATSVKIIAEYLSNAALDGKNARRNIINNPNNTQ